MAAGKAALYTYCICIEDWHLGKGVYELFVIDLVIDALCHSYYTSLYPRNRRIRTKGQDNNGQ